MATKKKKKKKKINKKMGDAYIRRSHTQAYTWATYICVARSQWVKHTVAMGPSSMLQPTQGHPVRLWGRPGDHSSLHLSAIWLIKLLQTLVNHQWLRLLLRAFLQNKQQISAINHSAQKFYIYRNTAYRIRRNKRTCLNKRTPPPSLWENYKKKFKFFILFFF